MDVNMVDVDEVVCGSVCRLLVVGYLEYLLVLVVFWIYNSNYII